MGQVINRANVSADLVVQVLYAPVRVDASQRMTRCPVNARMAFVRACQCGEKRCEWIG